MYDLSAMTLRSMTECSATLRALGQGASSMDEAAERVVRHLYDSIGTASGERACALVRFYKTHAYADLPDKLQAFARRKHEGPLQLRTRCLTLLATAGDQADWNDRTQSANHQASPLPSHQVVEQLPMVAQLVQQLGLEVPMLLRPDPKLMVDLHQATFNVFYVPDALGSPHIPAQNDFVIPQKIKSVLGFGGLLPAGDLFAIIMFTRTAISGAAADLFKPLALSAKLAVLPFASGKVFREQL